MNLKEITIILLFLSASGILLGQNNNAIVFSNTVLFKITRHDSDKTSYLFGTHHAFGKTFFDTLTTVNQGLKACDLLIMENLDIPGKRAEDIINQRTSVTRWENYLSKDDLSFIKKLFAKSPTDYNRMTPTEMYVFLNRYFKQQVCLNNMLNGTAQSLDDYIAYQAKQMHLQLTGLETTEEQIALINKDVEGMPKKVHKRRLTNIIEKLESQSVKDCEETDWYRNMEMDYQLNQPCRNTLILKDRNERWMMKIQPLLETNNCFVAVGLSHLMYECGLINKLLILGYKVEPVNVK